MGSDEEDLITVQMRLRAGGDELMESISDINITQKG